MLLGNADNIVQHLCLKLGWDLPLDPRQKGALAQSIQAQAILGKRPSSSTDPANEPEKAVGPTRVGDRYGLPVFLLNARCVLTPSPSLCISHVWLFEGADGGRWLRDFERTLQQERDAQHSMSLETSDEGNLESRNSKKARVM